jgi:16S rRNA (adenine1518-N6/adenine1519-N6)-dimethyltransferase
MLTFPSVTHIRALGIKPSRNLSQNFLIDRNIAAKLVEHAELSPADRVLEIGPGPGSISFFIIPRTTDAYFFELDRKLAAMLKQSLAETPHARVVTQDIMTVDLGGYADRPAHLTLIGSIPYAITSALLEKCFRAGNAIKHMLFIMQKEVAHRLCASPGGSDYGLLSVLCRAYTSARICYTIPPECFYPRPKVYSSVVQLIPRRDRSWQDPGEQLFHQVLKAAFSQRRKMLSNSLKNMCGALCIPPEDLRQTADLDGLDLSRRAETLGLDEFDRLAHIVNTLRR